MTTRKVVMTTVELEVMMGKSEEDSLLPCPWV